MTPGQGENLKRLLSPRSIACIGGADAAFAIRCCMEAGFNGPVWGVNPRRDTLGGQPCFPSVAALPDSPDAVFLAIPAAACIETVVALRDKKAGGVVCFTAGFGELGESGKASERQMIAAAGDMALVGPNCSGLLNFVKSAPLWPFHHRGTQVDKGVALITQSGMLGNTLTLNQRSLEFSYVISSGNQAMLGIEDYLEALVQDPAVTAIGLYIESLGDIPRFADAAVDCLKRGIPIVVQKAGSSEIGSRLTITHTGSLSGADELYQALFDRLDIIRVTSPVMMLETLKFLTISGAPQGTRVAAFTCSGGDATMVADAGERCGLTFPQPTNAVARDLERRLPDIATVSNPLDYTTPLWGDEQKLPGVLRSMLSDGYDAALMVQDFPPPDLATDNMEYLADTRSFISVTSQAGIPAAVASCLPENLDKAARDMMIAGGVAPLQGVHDALRAVSYAACYGSSRAQLLSLAQERELAMPKVTGMGDGVEVLDEWQGKKRLEAAGIPVPPGELTNAKLAAATAARIGFPVAVKMVSAGLPHKTEMGAIKTDLHAPDEVSAAVAEIRQSVYDRAPQAATDVFLIERMITAPVAEILLGVRHDAKFGQALVLASGGTLVELVGDSVTLLLPADRFAVSHALSSLKISPLLDGYRGQLKCDRTMLVERILQLADFAQTHRNELVELDINPLMIGPEDVVAVDVLLSICRNATS